MHHWHIESLTRTQNLQQCTALQMKRTRHIKSLHGHGHTDSGSHRSLFCENLLLQHPIDVLSKQAAAGGIAFINATGSLGGLVGPYAVGWLKDVTGSFNAGLMGMAFMLCLTTILTIVLSVMVKEKNKH